MKLTKQIFDTQSLIGNRKVKLRTTVQGSIIINNNICASCIDLEFRNQNSKNKIKQNNKSMRKLPDRVQEISHEDPELWSAKNPNQSRKLSIQQAKNKNKRPKTSN